MMKTKTKPVKICPQCGEDENEPGFWHHGRKVINRTLYRKLEEIWGKKWTKEWFIKDKKVPRKPKQSLTNKG